MVSPRLTPALYSSIHSRFGHSRGTVFGGCANTSAAMHFDRTTNIFLQLRGRKRFVLFSPDQLVNLYTAPKGHPYSRQSLLPTCLRNISQDEFPMAFNAVGHARIVMLEPGQALHLPPEWLHFTTSLTHDSLGIAMRGDFDSEVQNALREMPLPFDLDWEVSDLAGTVKYFVSRLLSTNSLLNVFKGRLQTTFRQSKMQEQRCLSEKFSVVGAEKCIQYAQRVFDLIDTLTASGSRSLLLLEYCDDVVLLAIPDPYIVWFSNSL